MFPKIIEIKEPASGQFVGSAKQNEKILMPDVSSCLAIIFQLRDGIVIAGHVPMMWGKDSSFELLKNAKKVIDEMLALKHTDIVRVVFIGDKSIWEDSESYYGNKIVKTLVTEKELVTVPYIFFDKEKIENANIHTDNYNIAVENTKTKEIQEINIDELFNKKINPIN